MKSLCRLSVIILAVVIGACQSKPVGPYILLDHDGNRVVRIKASQQPQLEYELPDKKFTIVDMQGIGERFHESSLPPDALRYRVLFDKRPSEWHDLAPVAKDVYRIIAYGDPRIGRGNPVARADVMKRMAEEKASLVIASGDLVMWGHHERAWKSLVKELKPLAAHLPYLAAIGNHDVSDEKFFKKYFRAAKDGDYASMPLGSGKLIILDSNELQERGNEQYKFLEKELAAARNAWPLVVAFHAPPFNFGHHPPRDDLITAWVPLFQKYAVDLVLLGHDHDYQRIGPIGGVLYVVTGGGGAPLVRIPAHTDPRLKAFAEVNHYVVLDIKKDGLTALVKDEDGKVIDSFSISR